MGCSDFGRESQNRKPDPNQAQFLADARLQQGSEFNLRPFHDYLWMNGNVPISLLRWEYLGLGEDIETLDAPS